MSTRVVNGEDVANISSDRVGGDLRGESRPRRGGSAGPGGLVGTLGCPGARAAVPVKKP